MTVPYSLTYQKRWNSSLQKPISRERSQRMDVLTTLLLGLMAFHGEIPQPELDEACEEREAALGRALEGWEREIIKAHLANDRLKAATPEE